MWCRLRGVLCMVAVVTLAATIHSVVRGGSLSTGDRHRQVDATQPEAFEYDNTRRTAPTKNHQHVRAATSADYGYRKEQDAASTGSGTGAGTAVDEQDRAAAPAADGSATADASLKGKLERQELSLQQDTNDSTKDDGKMNIVLFYADDWTYKTLGALNPPGVVHTPHLDEMARNGMLFTKNYVTTSNCWQSRATLMTGLYASVHDHVQVDSTSMFDGDSSTTTTTFHWNDTLYPQLKQHGYHVGFIGKWHAPLPIRFQNTTFDYRNFYFGRHLMKRNGQNRHVTDLNGQDALEYLRDIRPPHQAFALTISFFATHAWDDKKFPKQYVPQRRTASLYHSSGNRSSTIIPTPKTATEQHWNETPWFFTKHNEGRKRWRERYNTPDRFQESMRRYYRMASEVDDVVGDVIAELKQQGAYNQTLLVFTTDNGNFHGEHGLADKWSPGEESIHIPLIIVDPRMSPDKVGTVSDDVTLNLDLAPTLLSAAGIGVPPHMQGRDIADLYLRPPPTEQQHARNDASTSNNTPTTRTSTPPQDAARHRVPWRSDFFYEYNRASLSQPPLGHHKSPFRIAAAFALVQPHRFKYLYWPEFDYEQLFDVVSDPYEEHDIINRTDAVLLAEIKARYAYLKAQSQAGFPV